MLRQRSMDPREVHVPNGTVTELLVTLPVEERGYLIGHDPDDRFLTPVAPVLLRAPAAPAPIAR
jgi:hypothetical protein